MKKNKIKRNIFYLCVLIMMCSLNLLFAEDDTEEFNIDKFEFDLDSKSSDDIDKEAKVEKNNFQLDFEFIFNYFHPVDKKNLLTDPYGFYLTESEDLYRNFIIINSKYTPFNNKNFSIYFNNFSFFLAHEGEKIEDYEKNNFRNIVNDFYMKADFDYFSFSIGKKNIVNGVSYFKKPIDYLKLSSDVADGNSDFKYLSLTREGESLIETGFYFGENSLLCTYIPKLTQFESAEFDKINQSHKILVNLYSLILDTDINLLYYQVIDQDERMEEEKNMFPVLQSKDMKYYGLSISRVISNALELHFESSYRKDHAIPQIKIKKRTFGMTDFNYPVWEPGDKKHLFEYTIGGQYTFSEKSLFGSFNVICEYYYQNAGWKKKDWELYFDTLESMPDVAMTNPTFIDYVNFGDIGLAINEKIGLWGRHYLFYRITKEDLFDFFNLAYYQLVSLEDYSSNYNFEVSKKFFEHSEFNVTYSRFYGKERSEFGRLQLDYSIQFALKIYF